MTELTGKSGQKVFSLTELETLTFLGCVLVTALSYIAHQEHVDPQAHGHPHMRTCGVGNIQPTRWDMQKIKDHPVLQELMT